LGRSKVLIVEDDPDVRLLLSTMLERAGIEPMTARDGRQGLRAFFDGRPDAVVLDVALPELDGWAVLERIREFSDVPVMVLTASAGEMTKVRGLRAGADDYVTKPFGSQELLARIEALLRRSRSTDGTEPDPVIADELVEIDFARRVVTVAGHAVILTPREFKLLSTFVRNRGRVLSPEQLLSMVWNDPHDGSPDQVKLYVSYLRRKLRGAADVEPIVTVRGFGYRYEPAL
jgi:DNA-binding response OmpR family regulator